MSPEQEGSPSFEEIIAAARGERWDFVDEHLSRLANNPEVTEWALKSGLEDKDGNLRDLAASVLEKSAVPLGDEERAKLLALIMTDENPYARFRSAFALYARGDRSPEVVGKVEEALGDPAVSEIARMYLGKN